MKRLALGILLSVSAQALAQIPSSWTIPGTVNIAGLNGTRFVSDLALTNPGNVSAQVTISFIPVNGTTPKQVTLNAGGTVVYRNLLDGLWGAEGAGATQVASDAPLVIRARTYNTAASGTYGVALPVFADDRLLSLGDTADSLWISQSANASSGYRTNVAVVFPDDGGGTATVTIYDADGNEVGTRDYGLDAPGFQQFSVSSFAGAVAVGRAEVVVTSGRAAGYSVVVDNVTGDSSLFTFEDLPVGFQDVVLNGVARAPGVNGTFFRTDGRFYNPGSADAAVTVAFHALGASNPSPATASFTVPAGKIVEIVDVLPTLLGLPDGSAGALRFKSPTPVGILSRTSNVDPTGANAGTFGAQQRPVPVSSFLMSADPGAVVTGIRQSPSTTSGFRTNVGFAAGEDGASYALTLKDAAGQAVAAATRSLGSFGWEQPRIGLIFSGTTIPDDAQLLVQVTSGSVDVFDSSLDNLSGDSVVTPAARLSVNLPSAASIGPAGGSIRSSDGVLTLKIPAGALSAPVTIGLAQAPNDAPGGIGSGYDISPGGLAFAKPALLGLRYGPGGLNVPGIDGIALAFPSGTSWAGLTGGRIDTSARTLTVSLSNTNPSRSSPPPGGRGAHALAGASRVAVLKGLEIGTGSGTWVPTDAQKFLTPIFRLPPSGTGEEPVSYLITELNLDPLDVTTSPPTIGTISRFNQNTFTYTAPHSIGHASLPVTVRMRAMVTHGAGIPFGLYEATTTLHVVRRKWGLKAEFKVDTNPCVGLQAFGYSYSDSQIQVFQLADESLSLNAVDSPRTSAAGAVLKNCACTSTLLGQPGTITFTGAGGNLDVQHAPTFQLLGTAGVLPLTPSIQVMCPPENKVVVLAPFSPTPFFLAFLGGVSGVQLRPSDARPRFIQLEPPFVTITMDWFSIAE